MGNVLLSYRTAHADTLPRSIQHPRFFRYQKGLESQHPMIGAWLKIVTTIISTPSLSFFSFPHKQYIIPPPSLFLSCIHTHQSTFFFPFITKNGETKKHIPLPPLFYFYFYFFFFFSLTSLCVSKNKKLPQCII